MEIKFNAFETKYLGLKSGNVLWSQSELGTLDEISINKLSAEAKENKYNLISWRVPKYAFGLLKSLEKTEFRYIEEIQTFSKHISKNARVAPKVKLAKTSDLEKIGQIGESAFVFDRFHSDQLIDNIKANALKKAWAENCINHRADAVLIHQANDIEAFSGCIETDESIIIDLIAVKETSRGRGIGRALLASCEAYFQKKSSKIQASTQSSNLPSISLYKSCGFKLISKQITFHLVIK